MKILSKFYIKKEEFNKMKANHKDLCSDLESLDCFFDNDSNLNVVDIFIPSDFPFVYSNERYKKLKECIKLTGKYAVEGSFVLYTLINEDNLEIRRLYVKNKKVNEQFLNIQEVPKHLWLNIDTGM